LESKIGNKDPVDNHRPYGCKGIVRVDSGPPRESHSKTSDERTRRQVPEPESSLRVDISKNGGDQGGSDGKKKHALGMLGRPYVTQKKSSRFNDGKGGKGGGGQGTSKSAFEIPGKSMNVPVLNLEKSFSTCGGSKWVGR